LTGHIAEVLSDVDPKNADAYQANAATAQTEIERLAQQVSQILEPVHDKAFITAHDAYRYFERRFGVSSVATFASGDAEVLGVAHVSRVRKIIREADVGCVFVEPQLSDKLIRTAVAGTETRIGVLDPVGSGLDIGPDMYSELILNLANSLAECLSGA